MPVTLIRKTEYTSMAWKNQLGHTAQIAIWPPDAKFPAEKFSWRISAATVSGPNCFSNFPGYDRWLTVVEGPGLKLGNRQLQYGECLRFAGEDAIFCEPLGGTTVDLGIIFDRNTSTSEMKFLKLNSDSFTIEDDNDFRFIFVCRGKVTVESQTAEPGDTLSLRGAGSYQVMCSKNVEILKVTVRSSV